MISEKTYVPFSQRAGLEPMPAQLKVGEVSDELRRLINYYISLEIEREAQYGVDGRYFDGRWERVTKDFHVLFRKKKAGEYNNSAYGFGQFVEEFTQRAALGWLFDFVEFFVRHPGCSKELEKDLASAFITARSAYRILDNQIVVIGTEQQAEAFEAAVEAAENAGAIASRKHLVSAAQELRAANWAGSVRESIHAVEAIALKLAPETKTLGPALTKLEKAGHLHGSLKSAFGALYGYSSDEEGVRHALVFNQEAKVDETDALFMLGACASFVSYLVARSASR